MPTPVRGAADSSLLRGTPAVPGVGFGPAVVVGATVPERAVAEFDGLRLSVDAAMEAYDAAAALVADRLAGRAARTTGPAAGVLTATAGLARDKGLRAEVVRRLEAGDRLLLALHGAVEQLAERFSRIGGPTAERVADLRDVEQRLTAALVGAAEPGVPTPGQPSVLVADDLAPVDAAGLDPRRVVALVTAQGGPTSHTAIIARQLGIPCVVAVSGLAEVRPGTPLLVDGSTGEVMVAPDAGVAAVRVREARAASTWSGPGATSDGTRVRILANVSDAASATAAAAASVEGVGLFRTELCFLGRTEEPSVAEQAEVYVQVLAAFGPDRTVVVRTLDAGSDKPLAFAAPEGEPNPALGVRGIRLSDGDPGLLERQLEAVAEAARRTGTEPWVMAPMVATPAEAAGFAARVRAHGLRAGVMVEVPSAALQATRILQEVDFVSVGTNDLTQYTMAADRASSGLAALADPWQPAVLTLVAMTAEAARQAGKPVGVCGEAAADPLLATVLVGMGATSLSMAVAAVDAVGSQLALVTMEVCERAARAALEAGDPAEARERVGRLLARA
ncbi:phosphoenolpyruvate--protein phosphotransferase [Nocardioides pakistanensis]